MTERKLILGIFRDPSTAYSQ